MIELRGDTLHLAFPDVHPEARGTIEFQRTLRVPDDNQDYPLPAGFGPFPLAAVDDFPVPAAWREHGGVFLPIRRAEALWIAFGGGRSEYPMAVKIAAGKINAVTGAPWTNTLESDPQDYIVVPEQLWLDGFHASEDIVRQFVAMPLGEGTTAEEQLTGEATWGGLQIIAYPMKAAVYEKLMARRRENARVHEDVMFCISSHHRDMGLAAGGRIRQEIAEDPYGLDAWDVDAGSRCFVHLLNAEHWQPVTGTAPPKTPITAKAYAQAGVPWFDFYVDGPTLGGSSILAGIDGLASKLFKQGKTLPDNAPIAVGKPVDLSTGARPVRDGNF